MNIVSIRNVQMTHTHTDGTDIWPENAQFYNECKSTDPRARLKIVSIRKVHLTHTHTHTHSGTDIWSQTEQFYDNSITKANQWILTYYV